ncbi:hypothetical protein GCM10025867_01430 [Frondihabitans sucicola]|uniref:HpcH/HpaI aldolase/citrate lyase domain-containing protein n=1 Tax=Frondihabitans sucicola TaxID=1268041 RepID=A0ABN6XSE7_9MICO|nr:hypothetical protein GCM10025867_01430 [Frondihabitans sucicola]
MRVPETGSYVSRVLDAGAAGVLVPRIETAADAADVVARARYAPDGYRGLGPGRGGWKGGPIPEHLVASNAGVLVAIQIETRRGLDNADAILAVPGIDAVVIGPADLAASLGVAMGSDEHAAASDRIVEAALANDVAPGAFCMSVADAERLTARGARLLIVGGDGLFLAKASAEAWSAAESLKTSAGAVR